MSIQVAGPTSGPLLMSIPTIPDEWDDPDTSLVTDGMVQPRRVPEGDHP